MADEKNTYDIDNVTNLMRSALGVFDGNSVDNIQKIRHGSLATYRTMITGESAKELLEALDQIQPGLVDSYITLRKQSEHLR